VPLINPINVFFLIVSLHNYQKYWCTYLAVDQK
jgi:hypothetical protein